MRLFQGLVTHPLGRMWRSDDPIDAYGLNHLTSVAGDALLAISLSDSVFFSVPVGQARLRVTAYLLLTMLPLALAGPLIAPILDRAGPRRSITFAAAAARTCLAILLAPRLATNWLFPLALGILVCSKVHTIAKNALTMAYASKQDGLMRANARLGRVGVAGAVAALPFGVLALKAIDPAAPLYVAAAIYATSRGPDRAPAAPRCSRATGARRRRRRPGADGSGGAAAAACDGGGRHAGGGRVPVVPARLRTAGRGGAAAVVRDRRRRRRGRVAFVADVAAPALRMDRREEAVVIAAVSAAGIGALLASQLFGLPLLTIYAFAAGAASEFARLAFQALMQRHAPPEALGRVFVRYEVLFQVAWVLGAFVPVLLPISFRTGVLVLALFYGTLGRGLHLAPPPTKGRPRSACRGLSSRRRESEGGNDG